MSNSLYHSCDTCERKIADISGTCPMERFLRCDFCDIDICYDCSKTGSKQICCSASTLSRQHALTPKAI